MKLLLLVLSLALVACLAQDLDAGLAALVPVDTAMLAGVRMEVLRATPLYQKLVARQRLSDLDEFAARTHFDPRKDVREMLVASNGPDSVVLARGNFRVDVPKTLKPSRYKGHTLYGQGEGAFAILDPTTAIAGPERAVRKAIDQKTAGAPPVPNLIALARGLPATAQFWVVVNGWPVAPDQVMAQAGNLANFGRILRSMETTAAWFDVRAGVQGLIEGQCKTEQDAKTLSDAARGLVGLGRLNVPEKQPELLRFWDGIKAEQQKTRLRIHVQIPADLLDAFLRMTENTGRPRIAGPAK
ncbi:MAG: hypothetical protein HYR60_17705 [Acidobacteria bacterium]|nr:hypothetical protein [Acidobacteriota bacterium]